MKMTNQELILAYSGIQKFQENEKKRFEEKGEKILSGRIQLAFAISKNKEGIRQAIRPYEETKNEIIEEYRDIRAEQAAVEAEKAAAEEEKRPVKSISISLRSGKTMEEYATRLTELEKLETDFEPKKVPLSQFEGLDLTSEELGTFIFMIED